MRHQISVFRSQLSVVLAVCAFMLIGCESMPEYELPEVETRAATDITSSSAVLNGVFDCHGSSSLYVKRIFEFSNAESNLANNRYFFDDSWTTLAELQENNCRMTDLAPGETYYFRAGLLSQVSELSKPIYGEVMSFTTESAPAIKVTVTTEDVSSVTSTTARTPGKCSVENGKITESGILISPTAQTPTLSNYSGKSAFTNSKSFQTFWYELTPGTKYYYRAYAIDSNKNPYYGDVKTFTTKSEPGGSLTQSDFIGTYSVSAYSPWESKTVTWSNVQIIPYSGDTVEAIGFDNNDDYRAIGVFDKGMQVVRFESNWYFGNLTFDVDGYTCIAVFSPAYYNSSDGKAYLIDSGGKNTRGEIWLSKKNSTYSFVACDGDSDEGYYANGFIFDYYTPSTWVKHGNSNVYTNVSMTRTSTTTNKGMPIRMWSNTLKKNRIQTYENETTNNCVSIVAGTEQR